MRTLLRHGLDRYEVLRADEPLRRGERLVLFHDERSTIEFLKRVGGPGGRDLLHLAREDFAREFAGVGDAVLLATFAHRLMEGTLKLAQVLSPPVRLRMEVAEYIVLDRADRARRGESMVKAWGPTSVLSFGHLLTGIPANARQDLARRSGLHRSSASKLEESRAFSRLLVTGHIRIARVNTVRASAGGLKPPPPAQPETQDDGIGWRDAASLVGGFIPGISEGNDVGTILTGQDVISGDKVGWWGRAAAVLGILSPLGGGAEVRGIAKAIGEGHAFTKHLLKKREFVDLGIKNKEEFARFIERIMTKTPEKDVRMLEKGRKAFWDEATGSIVIHDPAHRDLGTAFRAYDGRKTFELLK
jgi:hypothetical protein